MPVVPLRLTVVLSWSTGTGQRRAVAASGQAEQEVAVRGDAPGQRDHAGRVGVPVAERYCTDMLPRSTADAVGL